MWEPNTGGHFTSAWMGNTQAAKSRTMGVGFMGDILDRGIASSMVRADKVKV
jgi:hypothetical protein